MRWRGSARSVIASPCWSKDASSRPGRSGRSSAMFATLPELFDLFLGALGETTLMVGVSALAATTLGIPLAVILVTSGPGGIYEAPAVNRTLGSLVNAFRSTPFIILLVALLL